MNEICPVTGATYNIELKAIQCLRDEYNPLDDQMVNIRLLRENGHLAVRRSQSELCDWGIMSTNFYAILEHKNHNDPIIYNGYS